MRNLREYPITYQEKMGVLKLCQDLLQKHEKHMFGGINTAALCKVIEDVADYENLKSKKVISVS